MAELLLTNTTKKALIDDEDKLMVLSLGLDWYLHEGSGYVRGYVDADKRVLLHRFIMGVTDPKILVDHIDTNKLNNQRYNLRKCTIQQNQFNRNSRKRPSSSKYKGVCWHKRKSRWVATIKMNGKTYNLGYFDDEVEAAEAYDYKALELFKDFARLNFPCCTNQRDLSDTQEAQKADSD